MRQRESGWSGTIPRKRGTKAGAERVKGRRNEEIGKRGISLANTRSGRASPCLMKRRHTALSSACGSFCALW